MFTIELKGSGLADVTGLIGQYAHGNEPSHHVTFLYALAGKPERTQELIREIFDTLYKNKPDGHLRSTEHIMSAHRIDRIESHGIEHEDIVKGGTLVYKMK